MALIKCVECGKEFSDKAQACPNCACPVEQSLNNSENNEVLNTNTHSDITVENSGNNGKKSIIIGIIGGIISLVIIFIALQLGGNTGNDTDTPNDNGNYNYNDNDYYNDVTPTYTISSIEGIGGVYKYSVYNECSVDNLTASIEPAYPGKLQVNYTITMTMKQRFGDNQLDCEVKLSVYDSDNIMVGSTDALIDINPGETGRSSSVIYIDESGTDYSIKISED